MRVKVKATGEIIEVTECCDGGYSDKNGMFYLNSEVEIVETKRKISL